MNDALARCAREDISGRLLCEHRIRLQHCDGRWRVVEDSPKEASRRTRELLGADKSNLGLNQLLWLDQGDIHLPDVKELEKLKQASDAEKLKAQDYDARLARIIQELREKGLDADRAATTAALADAVKRGIITLPVQVHLQHRLGLT